jgi:hypothetical protein
MTQMNKYASLADGEISSRQVFALVMIGVDESIRQDEQIGKRHPNPVG